MKIELAGQRRWREFYESRGMIFDLSPGAEPNDQGWVNFPCVLPTHPGSLDSGQHGGLNLYWGAYKCWHPECQETYCTLLGKASGTPTLSSWELIQLVEGRNQLEAIQIVEHRRLVLLEDGDEEFKHDDSGFTKIYAPLPANVVSDMHTWQRNLHRDIPIVDGYLRSRHLEFETLVQIGAGVKPGADPTGVDDELLLPYTVNGQLVGIRRRLYDNTKRMVQNSYTTLFNLDALSTTKSRTAIIVEGETDTLYLAQELRRRNLDVPVFGIPGVHFNHEWRRHLQKFQRVIAVPQSDRASLTFVRELELAFKERLEVVTLPWDGYMLGKDIVDYCSIKSVDGVIRLLGLTTDDTEPLPRVLQHEDLIRAAEQEVPWLIPGLLERGTKTLIVGPPKTYKTWLALQLANSVVSGEPFLGNLAWKPSRVGVVLFIEEEGSLFRLGERVSKVFGAMPLEGVNVIHRQGVRLDEVESLRQLRQDVLAIRPDLVVFDPYASLHSQDENTVEGTMKVVSAFDMILRVLPSASVVIVHHTPKGQSGARGSGALFGAVDLQIEIVPMDVKTTATGETQRVVTLNLVGRDLPEDESDTIQYKFDGGSGRHRRFENITVHLDRGPSVQELVWDYLVSRPKIGFTIPEIAEGIGCEWSQARDALTRLVEGGRIVRDKVGRKNTFSYWEAKE